MRPDRTGHHLLLFVRCLYCWRHISWLNFMSANGIHRGPRLSLHGPLCNAGKRACLVVQHRLLQCHRRLRSKKQRKRYPDQARMTFQNRMRMKPA